MAAGEVHVQDRGTTLRVTIMDGSYAQPLSNHTVNFLFTKPPSHETMYTKAGTIVSEVSGIVQYTFESGFLDTVGTWQYQLQVISGASQWFSDITKLIVHRNVI